MSTSIRKKYIKFNNEKSRIAKLKESSINDKNYISSTYINPKLRNKERLNDNSKENVYNKKEEKRKYNLSNIITNNKSNNNNNEFNTDNNHKNRRNLSQDFIKKNNKIDIYNIISVILTHEMEKIKINLLKYLINNNDMNAIFTNVYEIIEDLIDEFNLNNNYHLDKNENKRIIENRFQIIKNNIMHDYRQINKEIYLKYFSNKKETYKVINRFIPLSNFKKHCIKCKDIAIHKSKNPLFLIPNTNYIICKQTNEIYNKNYFECFCEYDGEIYISSYISASYKSHLLPLTYRNNLEDEMCKCSKCNHILYYNNRTKLIKCLKCNNDETNQDIDVFYNDIFFHKLKEEINFSLIMKRKSIPNKYCSCGGIFYQAKFLDKSILVCSQCKKCQYDLRNGRYKYRFYLFKNMRNENYNKFKSNQNNDKDKKIEDEKKIVNSYKYGNKNRNKTVNSNSINNINEEHKYQRYKNIDNDKNKMPKLLKTVKTLQIKVVQDENFKNKTNYNRFIKNNRFHNNSQYLNEEKNNNDLSKIQNNSGEILNKRKDFVKKKAKLLLANNNSSNIKKSFIGTSLFASRKERALNGNYFEKNENSLDKINRFKINKLLMNSLDQISFRSLMDNIDPELFNDIKNELNQTLSFKNTLTNNNSNEKININNTKKYHFNRHQSTNNIYANSNTIYKNLNQKKFTIPSNLNMNDYKILNLIGSGSFSNIYQVQNNKTKKKFAVKKIIIEGKLKLEKYKQDIDLIQSLSKGYFFDDINIVPIIQYYIKKLDLTAYALYELMPLAQSDWNKKILKEKINFKEAELIEILKQLTNALCYMQNNKICHRDIKPSNVLIINDNYYIGDLNECIEINGNPNMFTEIKGTEAFLSPIMFEALVKNLKKVKHNLYKSDVYSLGLCFVFAITRNLFVLQKIKETKSDEKIKKLILENKVDKKNDFSQEFINLLVKMLCWDEKNRMDFIDLNSLLKKMNI